MKFKECRVGRVSGWQAGLWVQARAATKAHELQTARVLVQTSQELAVQRLAEHPNRDYTSTNHENQTGPGGC